MRRSDRPTGGLTWTLRAGFVAAILALVAASVASVLALRRYSQAVAWVEHTTQVLRELRSIVAAVSDAESSGRGYIITQQPRFLRLYERASPRAAESSRRLTELTADNPQQQQRMRRVSEIAETRLLALDEPLALLRAGDREGAFGAVASGKGADIMERLTEAVQEAEAVEERLMAGRAAGAARLARLAAWLSLLTGVSAVFLVVAALTVSLSLARGRTRLAAEVLAHERAAEEVRRLNATLERRVEERTRQVSEANAELEAFGYTVSHDLRAPLRAMHGFATALGEDCGEAIGPDGLRMVGRIVGAAERMDRLIQDLLSYSRLSRSQVELGRVELSRVVREAAEHVEGASVEVREPMPAVVGQRAILVHVVENLLSNAVKFVEPGRTPAVRVAAERRDGVVRVEVADNGIGIDPEYHDKVFRVFERLHSAEAYPGTGVGLAIVRKGIERLGGRTGVRSRVGEGSVFWFELPAAETTDGRTDHPAG